MWLTLAKKGATEPTSLTYYQALEEAMCHGWIDGQVRGGDERSYRQRFTPRRPRSGWSKRNAAIAERLITEERMHASGLAAIERAKVDGRWEAAYAGPASIAVPPDLDAALAANPVAREMFKTLSGQNRYAVLYRIETATDGPGGRSPDSTRREGSRPDPTPGRAYTHPAPAQPAPACHRRPSCP